MKIMGFVVETEDLNLIQEDKEKSSQELVSDILKVFVLQYAGENKGLTEEERRKYYKLCDAMEKVVEAGSDIIELEDDYCKFLKSVRSKCKLMPNKLTQRVEALMDGIKEKEEESKKESETDSDGSKKVKLEETIN